MSYCSISPYSRPLRYGRHVPVPCEPSTKCGRSKVLCPPGFYTFSRYVTRKSVAVGPTWGFHTHCFGKSYRHPVAHVKKNVYTELRKNYYEVINGEDFIKISKDYITDLRDSLVSLYRVRPDRLP